MERMTKDYPPLGSKQSQIYKYKDIIYRWSHIALVKSLVVELPPRSAVLYLPSAIVFRIASWMRSALS